MPVSAVPDVPAIGAVSAVRAVRAVRGAIQLDVDEREHVLSATRELVSSILTANSLTPDDVISIFFTATVDVHSEFPAVAARELGLGDVPLMCAQELDIEGAMPRVIRLMAHINTTMSRDQITHIYLRGATALRRDLAQ
jgi:chorismate mutase